MPHTRPGWWSVRLGVGFVALFLINSFVFMPTSSDVPWRHVILPFYGIFMLLCGLGAGVMGLIAVVCQHERSWLVWLMLLPGLFVLFLLVGELLLSH
jgi:hypothetical protein